MKRKELKKEIMDYNKLRNDYVRNNTIGKAEDERMLATLNSTIILLSEELQGCHCDLKTCCVTASSTSNVKLGGELPVA